MIVKTSPTESVLGVTPMSTTRLGRCKSSVGIAVAVAIAGAVAIAVDVDVASSVLMAVSDGVSVVSVS